MSKENCFSICIIGFFISFSICYVTMEHNIYFWDYVDYQNTFEEFSEVFKISIIKFLLKIQSSVQKSQYNAIPVVLPVVFFSIFGINRIVYITSLLSLYYIPVCILIIFFIKYYNRNINYIFILLLVLLFTPFLYPTLRGYPDIGGILPLGIALYVALSSEIHKKIFIKKMTFLGLMLYMCFLFRRWYSFTVISFFISYFIYNIVQYKKEYKRIILNIFISGITVLALVLCFQFTLFIHIIKTNYYYAYTAFSSGLISNLGEFCRSLPVIQWIFIIITVIYEIFYVKDKKVLFLTLFAFTLLTLFNSMQHMDPQHRLPVFYILLFIFIKGIDDFVTSSTLPIFRKILYFSLLILFVINFLGTFFLHGTLGTPFLIQTDKCHALKHPRYKEFVLLSETLKNLIKNKNAKITILGTSPILNESMIRTFLGKKYNKNILSTSQIDRRDGIPIKSLLADYIVVADPVQYQFSPDVHTVITIPSQKIQNHQGLGNAFEQYEGYYSLGENIRAKIYHRFRDITQKEWEDYINSYPKEHIHWYSKNR